MASIALQAVGTSIGGPIGGAIGGLLGAFFDGLLLQQFAPTQDQVGPRIDRFEVTVSQEGASIPRAYGSGIRVDRTNILWVGDLEEVKYKKSVGSGKSKTKVTQFKYFTDLALGVCEGPVESIRKILANGKVVYDRDDPDAGNIFYDDIVIYTGTKTQLPSPLIEAREGVGEVPAFINVCYVTFERFALENFGRSIPTFSVILDKNTDYTVADMIQDVLLRGGLTTSDFSVDNLCRLANGLIVKDPESMKTTLDIIKLAFDVNVRVTNGVMEFYLNSAPDELTVQTADLSVKAGDMPALQDLDVKFTDVTGIDLPREVDVSFIDENNEYTPSTVAETRKNSVSLQSLAVNLPVSMDSAYARKIGTRQLWERWNERSFMEFTLGPEYLQLQETDRVNVTYAGVTYQVRITDVTRGFNFIQQVKARIQSRYSSPEPPPYLDTTVPGQDNDGNNDDNAYSPPVMRIYYLDIPALTGQEATQVGFYIAQSTEVFGAPFVQTDFYNAFSVFGNYQSFLFSGIDATLGETTDVLAAPPNPEVIDYVNTVTVVLNGGTLSSTTLQGMLGGDNFALVGNEIIAFQTATLVGVNTYQLSTLLRGRRATSTSGHDAGERFVLLDNVNLDYFSLETADLNQQRYHKGVPYGATVDATPYQQFTQVGESLRPFYPVQIAGERDGSDNLTISWTRRSRVPYRAYSGLEPVKADGGGFEKYEIDIMQGLNVVRTITVENDQEVVYSAAEQTTDFGSPQSSVNVKVYELNQINMRSNSPEVSV